MKRELWFCEECQRWERPSFGLLVGMWESKTGAIWTISNPMDHIDKWIIPNNFMWAREAIALVIAFFDYILWKFAK